MDAHLDLDAFLRTDPRDVACDEAMDLLYVYADLYVTDPQETIRRYPGVPPTCVPVAHAQRTSKDSWS